MDYREFYKILQMSFRTVYYYLKEHPEEELNEKQHYDLLCDLLQRQEYIEDEWELKCSNSLIGYLLRFIEDTKKLKSPNKKRR